MTEEALSRGPTLSGGLVNPMFVAELRIVPVGDGSSMEPAMEKVADAMDATGLTYDMGPMATTFEAETLDQVLDATKAVHETVAGSAPRVLTELSIDDRRDKKETMQTLSRVEA